MKVFANYEDNTNSFGNSSTEIFRITCKMPTKLVNYTVFISEKTRYMTLNRNSITIIRSSK